MRDSERLWVELEPLRRLSAARLRAWGDLLFPGEARLTSYWEQRWIAGKSEAYTASAALRPAMVLRCEVCNRESFAGYTEEMAELRLTFEVIAARIEREAAEKLSGYGCGCVARLTQEEPEAFDVSVAMILLERPDLG
jgi:hypothetical protein